MTGSQNETDVTLFRMAGAHSPQEDIDKINDAIDLASDQDQMTWLTENGKRIAAIVPVEVAEFRQGMTRLGETMQKFEGLAGYSQEQET
jgi:hypothetical protein